MRYNVDLKPPRWWPKRTSLIMGAVIFLSVILLASSCKTIPAGHVGILTLFGKVEQGSLPEGINFINPAMQAHVMSVRTQEVFEHAEVPSKEGLSVALEVSVLYRLVPEKAWEIYRGIGENYKEVFMVPQLRSAIRGVTVKHEAKDLYTSGRELVATQISNDLSKIYGERGIVLESVLLRKIDLPIEIQKAINVKLAAEQESERMKFVLLKEEQEAERKKIEATGIAQFQKIITDGLSDRLLQWKGIEATEKLSVSNNSKVIVIGGGKGGLPIIMNTQ